MLHQAEQKATFHQAQVDILNVEWSKRLNRFILVAQDVAEPHCEEKIQDKNEARILWKVGI